MSEVPVEFWYLIAFGAAWPLVFAIVNVIRRRVAGRPIFASAPQGATFVETWASGGSSRGFISAMSNAQNCLFVAVTRDRLVVRPHFPFVLLLPDFFGLELEVPRSAIRGVITHNGFFKRGIEVEFQVGSGPRESLRLRLREPEKFKQALGK